MERKGKDARKSGGEGGRWRGGEGGGRKVRTPHPSIPAYAHPDP